jgi:hypothetical protein
MLSATVECPDGRSPGTLAHATELGKSGGYAHFNSKVEMQLATVGVSGFHGRGGTKPGNAGHIECVERRATWGFVSGVVAFGLADHLRFLRQ